jgi:antitoxin component YwqK of YwqJK toxin-antitoxin module
MKIIAYSFIGQGLLFLSVLFCIATGVKAQVIDTFRTSRFGKMPVAYGLDKIYWERNYDDKGHLSFEGLRYNDCFIGAYANYWDNGRKKTEGQYLPNTTGDWKNLQGRGLCSVQDGEWKAYNEAGALTNKYFYENGKMVKEQPVIDTVTTADFGKMPPVYFSNKVYWERNYDNKNHLLFEALKYNACFIGEYLNYWENGKLKTKGQYLQNPTTDWTGLQKRGLCSVMQGEWKNFDATGNLKKTVVYEQGKIIKEY